MIKKGHIKLLKEMNTEVEKLVKSPENICTYLGWVHSLKLT